MAKLEPIVVEVDTSVANQALEDLEKRYLQFLEEQARLDAEHRARMQGLANAHYQKMRKFEIGAGLGVLAIWGLAVVWTLAK